MHYDGILLRIVLGKIHALSTYITDMYLIKIFLNYLEAVVARRGCELNFRNEKFI